MRNKFCNFCNEEFSIMFRIRHNANKNWVFSCKNCLISVKDQNPHYAYGGTWKK